MLACAGLGCEARATFERFTETARQVVTTAQGEACRLRHNFVGTEHLLLALLCRDSSAGEALAAAGVTHAKVEEQVLAIVGMGPEEVPDRSPFTPRAKKVLELALREALPLGQDYIGPEHVLLGILVEGEGVGARVLRDLGVDAEALRPRFAVASQPSIRPVPATFNPEVPGGGGVRVTPSSSVRRLLMSAAARALDDGRTEIEIRDVEEALRRREDSGEPPRASSG